MITGIPSGRRFPLPSAYTRAGPAPGARRRSTGAPAPPSPPGPSRQRRLPVDPGRPAPSVALRDLPHADQRVRPGPQHHLLQAPDLRPVLLPRRLEDPAPQPRYVLLMDRASPPRPSRERRPRSVHRHGVQLVLPFARLIAQHCFKGSPTHVSALSGPASRLVSGRLCSAIGGGPTTPPRFPVVFRPTGIRLLGILFPPRTSTLLTVGLPGECRTSPGPRRGFHVPHARVTAGLGPSLPRDHAVLSPTGPIPPAVARRLFQGPGPIAPVHIPSPEAVNYEASSRVHSVHPPGLLPGRSSLDGTEDPWALPRAPHPADQDLRRTPRRETGIEHSPGATARPTSPHLLSSSSLVDVRPRVARSGWT